ncbi:hypothetical protein PHET_07861 [Paragonimus heterotremus]|uniref:Protein YIPF n=1 Tax=Paragonimus heterotremus TaxID=100268 RepID=A0A8J4T5B8_9TREM|nr:hypothetical protein PHET_07861 [Paragonimus heterotremus]
MSLKFSGDDYVRVPLPHNLDTNDESETDLDGVIELKIVETAVASDTPPNLWNFEFYQQHFNVDTSQVLRRLAYSVIPNPRVNFVQNILKPQADLYGPFWIATTLILVSAISGNVSSYLQSRGQVSSWRYDFRKVTLASTVIYAYWWLVPLGIVMFLYMRSRRVVSGSRDSDRDPLMDYSDAGTRSRRSGIMQPHLFIDFLSVYGYSLAVFVPVSVLWAIPSTFFQWFLAIFAMAISGAFLTFALFPTFRREHQKLAGPLVVGLIVIHCVFSIGLMLTFFHGTSTLPNTKVEPVLPQELLKPAEVKEVKRAVAEPLVKLPIDVALNSTFETNRFGINT